MVSVNIAGFLKFWLVQLTLTACYVRVEAAHAPYVSKCASYPAEAKCGNATTRTITFSAEICAERFADTKCKQCISLSKMADLLNKFYSCKLQKKHISKKINHLRNVESRRLTKRDVATAIPPMKSCDSLEAPKPGKLSCRILPNGMNCTGTCDAGYTFNDGTHQKELFCTDDHGTWRPQRSFSPCQPHCHPPCQNGGSCLEPNRCFCTNDFRGPVCEHPISNCRILKTESSSSWKCNHTKQETLCSVACHPPGSPEAEFDFRHHRCNFVGEWTPELPHCVKSLSPVCEDPGDVENGWRQVSAQRFLVGSVVSYFCFPHHEMRGDGEQICLPNQQWNKQKPTCHRDASLTRQDHVPSCLYNGVPANAEGKLFYPSDSETSHSIVVKHSDSDSNGNRSLPIGSRIQYKCRSQYYKLYGSEYQTCQETGTWSGYKPACIPDCGKSDSPRTPFIINGNKTLVGQWPWQVAICFWDVEKKPHLICGGILITEKWVLTAAHCITLPNSNTPMSAESLSVIAGKYYRSFNRDDEHVQKTKVHKIIIHEDYNFIRFDSDIALVELDPPVELTSRVQPVCLPTDSTTRENIREGQKGIVVGWGLTEEGKFSEELRETILPVVSHSRCEENYREGLKSITVTENMFCAGYDNGTVDTCIGDSGGPMMFLDDSQKPHRWTLEGIVSWGSGDGCGQVKRFAGFTKVRKFVEWIKMFI